MLTSLCLLSCTLLLLCLCSPGAGQSDRDTDLSLYVEALKMGILDSLGMDAEPEPTEKVSSRELRKMYHLYWAKLRELGGNHSWPRTEPWSPTKSTVLFPASVRWRGERLQSGEHVLRYRAVFHNNPHIRAELTLARAELKISTQILNKATSFVHETKQEVRVKINGVKPVNSAAWTHSDAVARGNATNAEELRLDIHPEVEKWRGRNSGGSLVVDVGFIMGEGDAIKSNPSIFLELGLAEPKAADRMRLPRSNKEESCDEQGHCCRKSISVSFKDIGWSDWVLAPAEYTMHYCDGTCPHSYKPASMHAQVKARLHQLTKGGTPQPCCVPASYEPMVLMHYDSKGQLKLTPFNDLIVTKCHCA
ncbi:inhibin beta C chain-like [Thalassophryne amazonica]|uniref:inhibin beta C chain-like n=1 Tax=Thalassophryne amazonica TaxID=390379 RepID=UPI0014721F05|nr:inhibin beta C chain-like [Thalassophryne amazonica]